MVTDYNKKFKNRIKACKQKTPNILVYDLSVLWDTIQEINQSIQLAIEHNKVITVVGKEEDYSFKIGI